jgi:iron complex outermembrane recepter protein
MPARFLVVAPGACVACACFGLAIASAHAQEQQLPQVVVTASLLPTPDVSAPRSVAVLDQNTLQAAGQQHFEDVVAMVPNLNWAGDTNRPRYFQIRGIGELEQYQGAPNPSVGFLIDDIDFSGLGSAATLFDLDRIEVLRGPQATRYGANALAGLIYVTSAAPEPEWSGRAELLAGDYDTRSAGAVLNGPVTALDSSFRLAVQHFYTDGYYHNVYLARDDTNRRDELTLRGRWRYQPSPTLTVDLTLLHVQLDDGYDAFAVDNSRTTRSNDPSVDAQHSTGVALHATASVAGDLTLTGIATYAQTLLKYGFDGDWGNPQFWAPYVDNFWELQYRDRDTASLEFRLAHTPERGATGWLVGIYALRLRETLQDTSAGESDDPINGFYQQDQVTVSSYQSLSSAVFGVLEREFRPRWTGSLGLRLEHRSSDYHDRITNLGVPPATDAFGPSENLWGGDASLSYALTPSAAAYLSLARGYKAGGVNLSQGLLPSQLAFGPESDLNLELGYKAALADARVQVDSALFYLWRRNAQIKSSYQSDPNNPNAFVFYTGNAERGENYGLEAQVSWLPRTELTLAAALGLLDTWFENFSRVGAQQVTASRALANAPPWQAALSATWRDAQGRFARLDVTGMGAYYFDLPPNNTRSSPYALANGKIGIERSRWSVDLWCRNIFNKDFPVRGFLFGVVPPYYPSRLYIQLGDPRTFGVTVSGRY